MATEKKYTLNCGPGRTKQSFKDQCDINTIMARALKTGQFPLTTRQGRYADLSSLPDFKTALDIVVQGQSYFNALPSAIRDRFSNDPAQLLEFLNDKKNLEEAVKLGLVVEKTQASGEPSGKPDGADGAPGGVAGAGAPEPKK